MATIIEKDSRINISLKIIVCLFLAAVWLLVSPAGHHEAYAESKTISATAKSINSLTRKRINLPDENYGSYFYLTVEHWVLSSTDPEWDNAHVFSVRHEDPTKPKFMKGYMAITQAGGDQTFVEYDAKSQPIEGSLFGFGLETTVDVKGKYIGGTGKFEGIRGGITLKEKRTQAELTVELETKYEVK